MVLWTPQKTGSMHATFIFTHFDFMTGFYQEETLESKNKLDTRRIQHHHHCRLLDIHKNYDVIMTTRNPYSRFLSAFFYYTIIYDKEITPQDFRKFFADEMEKPKIFRHSYQGYDTIPKYFLRIENLYQDYLKIPFVRDSKLNECGILQDLCKKELNKNHNRAKEITSTKDFFTMDMIDYFYDNFRNAFDIDGYEKDSYKQFN
jgi:hypothetical protein